jgi:transcriptional antiterminator RfaH
MNASTDRADQSSHETHVSHVVDSCSQPYWAVVRTRAQRERAVRVLLELGHYEIYLPQILVQQRIKPLFPTYLFVRLGKKQHWYPIRWTLHVLDVLMSGDHPAQLEDKILDGYRKREGRDGFVKLPSPATRLRKGQQVRITRGSFAGQLALCEGMSGKDRVRVLLNMLGQKVPVELPNRDLEPLMVETRSSLNDR